MSYLVPIELKVLPKKISTLKDFVKTLNLSNDIMVFLSENCYSWLKKNSTYINNSPSKVFIQYGPSNKRNYIETINIDSSNCSFLKSIFCCNYQYEYSNGIPRKIIMIILENEIKSFSSEISAYVITTPDAENPVNCIINDSSLFDDSIVFLNSKSYHNLKKNTNTISNNYSFERLTWTPDDTYPGGSIMLDCLNYGSLYMICNMDFPFFSKDFCFDKVPKKIIFIG